ncbi:MAG: diguanylate cyclase [Dehalococcoidia bacterium]|nr:diguanylate cyclase [Dehalococcoidia bacterium]
MDSLLTPGKERKLRVLIVEDDPTLGKVLATVLGRFSSQVEVANCGEDALAVDGTTYDAVACDISLPDMSGLEVIGRLRTTAPAAGIVAVTGLVDVDVAVGSMKAGADDFLGKPFDPEILWHMLNRAVDNRARRIVAEQAAVYRELAYTDALTGCPNRRFLDEFLIDSVFAARRDGTPLSVAYLDIDNFKLLNDFVGHEQGDQVLRGIVRVLTRHINLPARFGRFGGDEFVVIFPGISGQAARRAMNHVQSAVANIEVENGAKIALPTRISFGVATLREGQAPRDLVAEAEDEMYLDKGLAPSLAATAAGKAGSPDALLKITNLKALRSLVKAIDRRDSYTRFHSDHATHMALAAAERIGLHDDQLNAITIGGPIHDLGKIVVPDQILRKPGALTAEERRQMEEHPVMGAAITAAVTDYDVVVELVRHHHERFDGGGYPGGLAREEVTLPTRLFSLADAFSAMTTDRPYRKALTFEQAVHQIETGSGTQFDPDLAREFIKTVEAERSKDAAA